MGVEKGGIEAFVSYAHEDLRHRDALEHHLAGLRRDGFLSVWHDALILPGTDFSDEIMTYLWRAELILLLVSADFLASEFIWEVELPVALERHRAQEAVVVPVILRPCLWADTELGDLQAIPTGGKPVTSWDDPDAAWYDVATRLKQLLDAR